MIPADVNFQTLQLSEIVFGSQFAIICNIVVEYLGICQI
ncbi:hypothetical protein AXFE_21650 [Acidithrix ferrooxidans]|uniref:Uncharacterized protein n=1 Tax=Acidithrix ferrooxidans TaxID=1280514 RepID=A0A0D8HGC2_9ACTN|nr:hypothetical protein AXFE_21650 [Acidithrix ferrooxidans]